MSFRVIISGPTVTGEDLNSLWRNVRCGDLPGKILAVGGTLVVRQWIFVVLIFWDSLSWYVVEGFLYAIRG